MDMVYVLGMNLTINDGGDQMENCSSISMAHRVQLNLGAVLGRQLLLVKKLQVKTNIQYNQSQIFQF